MNKSDQRRVTETDPKRLDKIKKLTNQFGERDYRLFSSYPRGEKRYQMCIK